MTILSASALYKDSPNAPSKDIIISCHIAKQPVLFWVVQPKITGVKIRISRKLKRRTFYMKKSGRSGTLFVPDIRSLNIAQYVFLC